MGDLVVDLLERAKLEADGLRLETAPFSLADAWARVRDGLEPVAAGRQIRLVADLPAGIPRDDCERTFEPFARLAEHERVTGTGPGLPIARAASPGQRAPAPAAVGPLVHPRDRVVHNPRPIVDRGGG